MIKLLAEQAEKECAHITKNYAWEWEIKFAELIIQECNKLLSKNSVEQYTNAIKLEEHFFPHD